MADFGPITVGTTSTAIRNANASRKLLTLVNTGKYPVYLMASASAPTAVVGQGIRLNPHGGTYSTSLLGAWAAISNYATAQVSGDEQ